jgi:Flp pilus assembly protein TadG
MAKACARAAAQDNTPGGGNAQNLANQTLSTQNNSSQLMSSPTVQVFWDNPQTGSVTCQTNVICNLPVPVPFINLSTIPFSARSTEPEINVLPQ